MPRTLERIEAFLFRFLTLALLLIVPLFFFGCRSSVPPERAESSGANKSREIMVCGLKLGESEQKAQEVQKSDEATLISFRASEEGELVEIYGRRATVDGVSFNDGDDVKPLLKVLGEPDEKLPDTTSSPDKGVTYEYFDSGLTVFVNAEETSVDGGFALLRMKHKNETSKNG